jgi:hypothetical protein
MMDDWEDVDDDNRHALMWRIRHGQQKTNDPLLAWMKTTRDMGYGYGVYLCLSSSWLLLTADGMQEAGWDG